jgi:hypothetical protein
MKKLPTFEEKKKKPFHFRLKCLNYLDYLFGVNRSESADFY